MNHKANAWSAEDTQFLRERYLTTTAAEIGRLLGRSEFAVVSKAKKLGMQKKQTNSRPWTAVDDEIIKSSLNKSVATVAEMLGRSEAAIYLRHFKLGVHRGKSRHHASIGDETYKRGKLVRKVSETGVPHVDWKRVDVIEWEAIHGPVPEGMMLVKKRGMPRSVENLELASPADMPFTAVRHHGNEELRKLLILKARIGQAMKNIEKRHFPDGLDSSDPEAKRKKHLRWRGPIGVLWTDEDIEYLKANLSKPNGVIGAAIGRTSGAVATKKTLLGLTRTQSNKQT
jgi:hypothetical protein